MHLTSSISMTCTRRTNRIAETCVSGLKSSPASAVHDGGGVTNLTADEWLERWQVFRQRHPEYSAPPRWATIGSASCP